MFSFGSKGGAKFDISTHNPNALGIGSGAKSGAGYNIEVWDPKDYWKNVVYPGSKRPKRSSGWFFNLTAAEGLWTYMASLYAPPLSANTSRGIPYLGLIDAASFTAVNFNDTANRLINGAVSFPTTVNWKENVGYVGGVRPALGALYFPSGNNFGSGNNVTVVSYNNGAAPILFNANNNGNLQGAFICCGSSIWGNNGGGAPYNTSSLLGGPGLISAAAAAGAPIAYNNGQIISVSVSITQTSN